MFGSICFRATLFASALTMAACAQSPQLNTGQLGNDVVASMRSQDATMRSLGQLSRSFQREVPFVVHFAFNSDELDVRTKARLDQQAAWILDNPKVRFSVTGHTDKVGNRAYNQALGLRRARAVASYLVARGVDPSRLVTMISEGETNPLVDTETRERQNRRFETSVLEFIKPSSEDDWDGNTIGSRSTIVVSDAGNEDETGSDPDQRDHPDRQDSEAESGPDRGSKSNSGRGNGDEDSDPGKSAGKNRGGDEV